MSGILYETGADLVTSTGEMTGAPSSVARSTWYELVIGWDRGVTGYFTLDRSLLDGPARTRGGTLPSPSRTSTAPTTT
jgi:hypothetical protein